VSVGFSGSLRVLVHRTLKRLKERGVVEMDFRKGPRGWVSIARKIGLEEHETEVTVTLSKACFIRRSSAST